MWAFQATSQTPGPLAEILIMHTTIYFLLLFLLVCCRVPGKVEFEGKITYKIEITSPKGSPFVDDLQQEMGDVVEVFFKGGMYRMNFNGQPAYNIIHIDSLSRQYTLFENIDTLFIDDCAWEPRKVLGISNEAQVDTVLGMVCNKFTMELENERKEFFYSPDLYISASRFENHKFGHVDVYYMNCQSPFLKRIQHGPVFTITYEAIAIEPMKLGDSLFVPRSELPTSSKFRK